MESYYCFTNTIYVDNVSEDKLKIMNQAKEKFQKEYDIDNLERDTKKNSVLFYDW